MVSTVGPRLLIRLSTVALAVVAGLLVAVVIDVVRTGGPSAWLARHQLAPPYDARGQRFDIGGHSLYLDLDITARHR